MNRYKITKYTVYAIMGIIIAFGLISQVKRSLDTTHKFMVKQYVGEFTNVTYANNYTLKNGCVIVGEESICGSFKVIKNPNYKERNVETETYENQY